MAELTEREALQVAVECLASQIETVSDGLRTDLGRVITRLERLEAHFGEE